MAKQTNTQRIGALENRLDSLESKLDRLIGLMENPKSETKSRGSKTSTKENREAQREAEKADFKANHKLVRSSKQNKELVYAEMKKQGITEFNRKDYERIAKGLGVLGKSGKVVSTWEEIK